MIFSKIWQRYLLKEMLKVFLLFIAGFYFLYALIDYSSHAKSFSHAHFSFFEICIYYACHFTQKAQIIVPFALMLASIKVIIGMNVKRELVALRAGGISASAIIKPTLFLATFAAVFLLANFQFLQPIAENILNHRDTPQIERTINAHDRVLHSLSLKDSTKLVYQYYDQKRNAFFDAFWIKDRDHIYRIKYLYPHDRIPHAQYVDLLERDSSDRFVLKRSWEALSFPKMTLDEEEVEEVTTPPMEDSITNLVAKLIRSSNKKTDEKSDAIAALTYKLLMPLIVFAATLIPAPYCMRFGRSIPLFFLYAISIFGFISLVTIIDASFIVAESGVFHPFWTIFTPIALISFITYRHYRKLNQAI